MKEIKLSQQGKNKGKYVALVDDEDFEKANQFRWYVHKVKYTFYAVKSEKKNKVFLHQFILKSKWIDHMDMNGLNCQKLNMRKCTHQQNSMNRIPNKKTTSIYKGVYFHKGGKKWLAQIRFNGILSHLGCFTKETDAAKAYDKKAKELFGKFAYLNFKELQCKRTRFNNKN